MNESEGDLMDKLNQYVDSLVGGCTARAAVPHLGVAVPHPAA